MNHFAKLVAFASFATVAAGQNTNATLMVPLPAAALATLPDTRLLYWDTGGDGIPVVLVHPATGSALIWDYQQPAFSKAGYRVIGYSRRSYYGSDPVPKENPGVASEDLYNLIAAPRTPTCGGVAAAAKRTRWEAG